ncbi:hypothetical protein AJ80_05440 [Polytolypa hystricis UAMH7299]|uniref:phosphatidylinositol-3,4,5-trisphosphate 3-phosphatase n=1 Tax=Polytolypa hystricis (strain UAMH7299) TaxID=1447883 RepID=A0A2B7Y4H1_POLH7|nr:hypothetical protein AJ80_05440 [Polytolypa hystricis UAMH7299]
MNLLFSWVPNIIAVFVFTVCRGTHEAIVEQAFLLRQLVAGPRLKHPEAGLDLCYVTDEIIATSGPSSKYPKRAYRNPTDALVRFLDEKHGENWWIWEFRAEGTGYPDEDVYGRIHHYPWPDHHPPPFALIPAMMASMRNWLAGDEMRMVVVHCKAGKGRSGTVACSFLVSERGWSAADALTRFTERRMRLGFGPGVSIPSQLRWVGYVDRWANELGKKYVERPVEIVEMHVWGLSDGVKVDVEGYVDEGRKIKCFHRFHRSERVVVDNGKGRSRSTSRGKDSDIDSNKSKSQSTPESRPDELGVSCTPVDTVTLPKTINPTETFSSFTNSTTPPNPISAAILRPKDRIFIPTSDVNISFERRALAPYTGWAMVTSIAHIWFNAYFEGGHEHNSGVFEAEWEALDGIKGTGNKGIKALERIKVVWRYVTPETREVEGEAVEGKVISEPAPGEPVPESHAADWRGPNMVEEGQEQGPWESNQDAIRDNQAVEEGVQDKEVNSKMGTTEDDQAASPSAAESLSIGSRGLGLRRQSIPSTGVSQVTGSGNFAGYRPAESDDTRLGEQELESTSEDDSSTGKRNQRGQARS